MKIDLTGKPYTSKSIIASNQRCMNLYGEANKDPQAPVPVTEYLTPGTVLYSAPQVPGRARASYSTSIGTAYIVIAQTVYFVAANGALVFVGNIADRASQVIMADNGLTLVLVDGVEGWVIDLATNAFSQIIDPAFYGADYVIFLDTFYVFNRPDTNQFYISVSMADFAQLSGGSAFDPLDIAAKSGSADHIVAIATAHKELWLIGSLTTEVWIGTGAADFYFQLQQGAYINHGCCAPFSVAGQDVITFWIMQDKEGSGIVVRGANYQLSEISTPAIVAEFKRYATMADAIGTCFQIDDHAFYCLSFPTANKTWLYDLTMDRWTEWSWLNVDDGSNNRHRINTAMFVYGKNLIIDWETGTLWQLDPDVGTDNEVPIVRTRTFMHMLDELNRVSYLNFTANMQVGTSPQVDVEEGEELPTVRLSWSDDRGKTFSFPIEQTLGNEGQYDTILTWNRLGMARDRVFKLEWSAPVITALNGAFMEAIPCRS